MPWILIWFNINNHEEEITSTGGVSLQSCNHSRDAVEDQGTFWGSVKMVKQCSGLLYPALESRGMVESFHMCSVSAVVDVFGHSKLLTAITALDMVSIAIYESV